MNICFICHIVDETDPINAALVRWIEVLASKPQVDNVIVIPLDDGRKHPWREWTNHNVFVGPAIRGRNRLETVANFYQDVWFWLRRKEIDCFFLWGGGPYPALLLPLRLLFRKPLYHWKAHRYINPLQRFYVRCCDTKLFTSTPSAVPLTGKKIKVVGQGIDVSHFRIMPEYSDKHGDLVTVNRVSRAKRIHVMIDALKRCNDTRMPNLLLDVYGPYDLLPDDRKYYAELRAQLQRYGMTDQVRFLGPVLRRYLPRILNQYKVYLNFSYDKSALDRAVVEAMACGLPVISCNPCVRDILHNFAVLRDFGVMVEPYNIAEQANRIKFFLNDYTSTQKLAHVFRSIAEQHSDEVLWDRILEEIA